MSASYRYPSRRRGLEPVDLDVFAGDLLAVIGPNGAGKSTLLRLLAGEFAPSGGQVQVFGRPAHALPPSERARLGVGVDEPAHADELAGRENAHFFARANGLRAADATARVDALFQRLGLSGDAGVPAGAWSFGMRRKLHLVETLAHAPDLVLLDEPTIGLDAGSLAGLRALLAAITRSGAAIVFATNDLHGLVPIATRIVFLHDGRKAADASPSSLLERVRGVTRFDIALDGQAPREIRFPPGATGTVRDGGCVVETAAGTELLPGVCAALVQAGARIRAIRVREPDLTDVFRELTGAELDPTGPSDESGHAGHQPASHRRAREADGRE